MEENFDKNKEDIYSKRVKAGKRTYFIDVKATRSDDYYLTITESKRKPKGDDFVFEKHKLFLYKEDFEKFSGALLDAMEFIKTELTEEEDPYSEFDDM